MRVKIIEDIKDLLTYGNISYGLNTEFIGKNIICLETIDSTNSYGKKRALQELDGTVIISEEQT